jgi:hypothetical protein
MIGRRIGVLAVGVVAGATVAGCGGDVKYAGQEISSDVSFLGQIEQQFRDDTGHGSVKVGHGSHCWLLRDKDSGEIDPVAACGPVRHLGAADTGVWDLYRFKGTVSGKTLTVADVAVDKAGAALPADREPYRGDDATVPADADALSPPEAPPARPGMAKVIPDVKVDNVAKPQKGKLIIPGGTVEATEVGEVRTIPGDEQSPVYRPADGEEFRAVSVTITPDENAGAGSVDVTPAYSVKAGSQRIAADLGRDSSGQPVSGAQVLVVSVPKGQDAELVVSVAGVDQALSVRTGDRTSTTAAAYYRENSKIAVGQRYPSQHVTVGQFQLGHQVTFTEATVTPFDPDKGWAPAGKAWLELGFTGAGTDTVGSAKGVFGWTANTTGQLTVVDDKRRRSPVTVPSGLTGHGASGGTLPIAIAADATWVQLSYGPLGTFTQNKAIYRLTPPSGHYAFKRITFRLTIPQ